MVNKSELHPKCGNCGANSFTLRGMRTVIRLKSRVEDDGTKVRWTEESLTIHLICQACNMIHPVYIHNLVGTDNVDIWVDHIKKK